MEVILHGRSYSITRHKVGKVAEQSPGPLQRYAVRVDSKEYPLKQAACEGIGLPPVAFTSQQAYRWLTKLGFDVIDKYRAGRGS